MPSLTGTSSPLIQNVFAQRELRPLMTDISSSTAEKPPLPSIVVTPSTPSDDREFRYPIIRFQPNYEEYDDEFDRLPSAEKSGWRSLVPVRVLRVTGILAVMVVILFVHVVILKRTQPGDTGESE